MEIELDGQRVFSGRVTADQEVGFSRESDQWQVALAPRRQTSLTAYRTHPIAEASEQLTMRGVEAPLAIWIADAMRAATGADIALFNRRYARGMPIPKGVVDQVDLIQCSRPVDQRLALTELTGRDIVEILEDNLEVPERLRHNYPSALDDPDLEFLVQPSGFSYSFDRSRPHGQRIVSCDLGADRTYQVALEGQVPERAEVWRRCFIRLAGKYPLDHRVTEIPLRGALYAHAQRSGTISAAKGRVRAV